MRTVGSKEAKITFIIHQASLINRPELPRWSGSILCFVQKLDSFEKGIQQKGIKAPRVVRKSYLNRTNFSVFRVFWLTSRNWLHTKKFFFLFTRSKSLLEIFFKTTSEKLNLQEIFEKIKFAKLNPFEIRFFRPREINSEQNLPHEGYLSNY